jgi:hypothetical protein
METKSEKKWEFNFQQLTLTDQEACVKLYNQLFEKHVYLNQLTPHFLHIMEIVALAIHGCIKYEEIGPNEYELVIAPEIEVADDFIQTIIVRETLISIQQHLVIAYPEPLPKKANFEIITEFPRKTFLWEIFKGYDFWITRI